MKVRFQISIDFSLFGESLLFNLCTTMLTLQGMETMIVRYNSIVTSVKKKGYDLLDHRKGEVWRDRSVVTG